ncbi:UV-B-induced protein At3g17800, chloroplastic isoform X2 [Salvia splendens]|uniref:UV-B-induced protein At3g17800, chloroplastic isoform X2 n=1 Tax=Salvia splendens TaxID=180675 RepID=UPI001C26774B|nr:UV-B-induced protein At3g17800, chloroplastic isoform X2 [Salvia splendens]
MVLPHQGILTADELLHLCLVPLSMFLGFRRIAEFRQHECQDAVEDVMYVLIFYKFSEIGVSLVPRLSKCAYNGRLEIWPSKDWELESIHNAEVLQMVREHLSALVGCKASSSVTDSWATTKVQRFRLCEMYAASILYGYFLKSASLRYQLERGLDLSSSHYGLAGRGKHPVSEMFTAGSSYIAHGRVSSSISTPASPVSYSLGNNPKSLRLYMMGFDHESVQMCAKPKSKEAVDLLERHTSALFGDEETGLLETDDAITTSFASLKRFLLEAVAFGSFLWSAENFVSDVYTLEDN